MKKKIILILSIIIVIAMVVCIQNKTSSNKQNSIIERVKNIMRDASYTNAKSLEDFNTVNIGIYNNEPVEWIPVKKTNDAILLVTKYVIDVKRYNMRKGCFWQNCELREWLNNEFFNNCFDASEKDLIIKSYIPNKNTYIRNGPRDIGYYGNGEDTVDKCFIFSSEEWWDIVTKPLTIIEFTEYAKSKANDDEVWTREQFTIEYYTNKPGGPGISGSAAQENVTKTHGIRVSMWIKLKNNINVDNYLFYDGNIIKNQEIVDGYNLYKVDNKGMIQRNKWVGNKYYDGNGYMLKNAITPDGKFVNRDGDVVDIKKDFEEIDKNEVKANAWFKTKNGIWYYFMGDKTTLKKGWFVDPQDEQTYYLEPKTGIMLTGWQNIDGKEYYYNESHDNEPNWYYVAENDTYESYGKKVKAYGSMFKDEVTPDGYYVDKDGVKSGVIDAQEYIFPDSDKRLLTAEEVMFLDATLLRYAINEIYARHGRIFKDAELNNYFTSKSWYHGLYDNDHFDESCLSDIEFKNIDLLVNAKQLKSN